jgi:hypothetical protein
MTRFGRFERWWFGASSRYQPGVLRVLLVAWLGHYYATRLFPRFGDFATRSPELLDPLLLAGGFAALGAPIPTPERWVFPIEVLAWVLTALSLVGFGTRVALGALALLNAYLGAVAHSWGYTPHAAALPALMLLVLTFSPGAASFSIDAVLRARRAGQSDEKRDWRSVLFGGPALSERG